MSSREEAALRKRWAAWEHVVGEAQLFCLATDFHDILDPLVDYVRRVHDYKCPSRLVEAFYAN